MRKLLAVIGLAFGSIFLGHTIAQACGDKLLALGRGVSFQRAYRAARPASILLYLGQNSKSGPIGDPRLQATLKSAGHTLRVAADAGQLDQLLKFWRFDVVLADLSEVGALSQQANAAPSKPTVMPVMYKPTRPARVAAEKQYGPVLNAQGKAGEYLMAIEEVMKRRAMGSV